MVVEIYFFKLEGAAIPSPTAHHVEVIDVADQKSITSCWQTLGKKFDLKSEEMVVYEGYLTHSRVLPTTDDLQRIWLSYLENEDVDNTDYLRLRLFVSSAKSDQKTTASTAAAATASSVQDDDNSRIRDMLLSRAEDWVRLAEAINTQVLTTTFANDALVHDNAALIDLVGRGVAAFVKLWWLFTQKGGGINLPSSPPVVRPAPSAQDTFFFFQILGQLSACFSGTPTAASQATPAINNPAWNTRMSMQTYNAVESYIRRMLSNAPVHATVTATPAHNYPRETKSKIETAPMSLGSTGNVPTIVSSALVPPMGMMSLLTPTISTAHAIAPAASDSSTTASALPNHAAASDISPPDAISKLSQ